MNETEREAEKQPFVEDFEAKLEELRQAESSAQVLTTQGRVLSEQGKVLSEFYDIEQAHRQPGLSPELSGEFGVMQRFLIKIRFDRDRRRELELASKLLMQCRLAYLRTRFEQRLESSRLQAQIVDAEDRKELDNKLLRVTEEAAVQLKQTLDQATENIFDQYNQSNARIIKRHTDRKLTRKQVLDEAHKNEEWLQAQLTRILKTHQSLTDSFDSFDRKVQNIFAGLKR